MTVTEQPSADDVFKGFVQADSWSEVTKTFKALCDTLRIDTTTKDTYEQLKGGLKSSDALTLFTAIDKRAQQKEYEKGEACSGKKTLVIGAGPCGLRMAIECALLGSEVSVVEMRDYITRNNVLHLWPFVIQDLKALGTKVFYRRFCTGGLDHISIRTLQLVLLKLSLMIGVKVYAPVKFSQLVEPCAGRGWHVMVEPSNHSINTCDFDFIIGADGKRNSLPGYTRKCFRGKLAVAITLNLVNKRSKEENRVSEIGGLFYIFAQEFFNKIKDKAGIDLENIVYYQDETHYFVMTAKKQSLLDKGVLREDTYDPNILLSKENLDREKLLAFAVEAADIATDHKLPHLEVAKNHYGEDDVAIFDFTAMQQAEQSCIARERQGKSLLTCIVGDTLIEPFWPTGSGCARGFLSVFDAAWLIKEWSSNKNSYLDAIENRETVYQLLSQTTPSTLSSKIAKYTINPESRYGSGFTSNTRPLSTNHIQSLYVTKPLDSKPVFKTTKSTPGKPEKRSQNRSRNDRYKNRNSTLDSNRLLKWFQSHLESFKDVIEVTDLNSSWRNGLALCSLIQLFRPHLIDVRKLDPSNEKSNCQMGLNLVQKEFNVTPLLNVEEMVKNDPKDRLLLLSYLVFLQEALDNEPLPKLRRMNQKHQKTASGVPKENEMKPSTFGLALSSVCKSMTLDRNNKKPDDIKTLTQSLSFQSMSLDRRNLPRVQMAKISNAVRKAYVAKTLSRIKKKWPTPERMSPPLTPSIKKKRTGSRTLKKRLSKEMEEKGDQDSRSVKFSGCYGDPAWWTRSLRACKGVARNRIKNFSDENTNPSPKMIPKNVKISYSDVDPEYDNVGFSSRTLRACKGKAGSIIREIEGKIEEQDEDIPENDYELLDMDDLTYNDTLKRMSQPSSNESSPKSQIRTPTRRSAVRRKLSPQRSEFSPIRTTAVDIPSKLNEPPHLQPMQDRSDSFYPTASLRACKGIAMGRIQAFQQAESTQPDLPRGPPPQMTRTKKSELPEDKTDSAALFSNECCICGQHLFLVERHVAHGFSFHKSCYKCYKCNVHLRGSSSVPDTASYGPVRFYCHLHALEVGLADVPWSQIEPSECDTTSTIDMQDFELTADEMLQYMIGEGDSDVESSSDDEYGDDDEYDGATAITQMDGKEEEDETIYQNEASEQMILADEIQRELNNMDEEEKELEDRGRCVERSFSRPSDNPENEEAMDEWVDVIHRKQELAQKEAQLMLQVRLLALRQRQMNLERQLTSIGASEGFEKAVSDLDAETDDLEREMTCLLEQLADLHLYIGHNQSRV